MKTIIKHILTLCISLIVCNSFAQEKKFDIGLRSGVFVPTDFIIQGYQLVNYVDGSPTNISISGFGNGTILNIYFKYFIWEHTGFMLDGGANLLYKNSLELALAPNGETLMYENHLTVFPVSLCLIHRVLIPETKFSPFLGAGAGVYFSEWEQKYFPENGTRTWTHGSEIPFGFKFFTGFDFSIYHDLILNVQLDYDYAATDWNISNVDTEAETEYRNLNTGGISFKFGLGFKF